MRTETYNITIHCGLREGYGELQHPIADAERVLQDYCDGGFCVSLTRTVYVYKGGREEGIMVGIINYPRFPATPGELKAFALDIASRLKEALGQLRVTLVCDDETIMLGQPND